MSKFKKFTILLSIASFILLGVCTLTLAQKPVYADATTDSTVFKACEGTDNDFCHATNNSKSGFELIGPTGIITRIAQIIVWLVGIVSVFMVAIGGFKYAVSGGDSAGVQSAKNTILYALVGLAVAIFAQVIVSFVLGNL